MRLSLEVGLTPLTPGGRGAGGVRGETLEAVEALDGIGGISSSPALSLTVIYTQLEKGCIHTLPEKTRIPNAPRSPYGDGSGERGAGGRWISVTKIKVEKSLCRRFFYFPEGASSVRLLMSVRNLLKSKNPQHH